MAESAGQGDRRVQRWLVAIAAAVVVAVTAAPVASQPPGWAAWEVTPGVHHLLTERPGLVAHAAVIGAGAGVELRPVVAFDRVGGGHAAHDGRQPVTDLCARAGGVVCVNGDFFNCGSCGQVAGGLVDRGRALRSFRPDHEQVAIVGGVPTLEPLAWVGSIHGAIGRDAFNLPLASLNRGPQPQGAVLYTPDWGPATPQVPGQVEIVFAAGGPHVPGVRALVPVSRRPHSGAIPRDGVVITANGRAAERLNWVWDAWHAKAGANRALVLDTALSAPADLGVGGHPVLLRDGVRQPLDHNDSLVMGRHPRTLLGWTGAGDLLLVTIDGRQRGYSHGATLHEATNLLLELGATNAINLDGGGSTTFALRCGLGACVANRPSDGRPRPVAVALAVVPVGSRPEVRAAALSADAPVAAEPTTTSTAPHAASPPPSVPTTAPLVSETTTAPPRPAPVLHARRDDVAAGVPPPVGAVATSAAPGGTRRWPAGLVAAAPIVAWVVTVRRRRALLAPWRRTADPL